MTENEDGGPELPEGFEAVEATVCRRGDELLVFGSLEPEGPFVFHLRLAKKEEDFGPPPPASSGPARSVRRKRGSGSGRSSGDARSRRSRTRRA